MDSGREVKTLEADGDSLRQSHGFSALAITGFIFFGITVLALHFLPTGYTVKQYVTDYAVGQYGVWMDLAFFALGIGVMALAFSLSRLRLSPDIGRVGTKALIIAGACIFVIGMVPADVEGAPITTHGMLHFLLFLVAFISLIVGILVLSRRFRGVDRLRTFYSSSMLLAAVFTAVFVLTFLFIGAFGSASIIGADRASIIASYSWLLLTAIRIFRLSQ